MKHIKGFQTNNKLFDIIAVPTGQQDKIAVATIITTRSKLDDTATYGAYILNYKTINTQDIENYKQSLKEYHITYNPLDPKKNRNTMGVSPIRSKRNISEVGHIYGRGR